MISIHLVSNRIPFEIYKEVIKEGYAEFLNFVLHKKLEVHSDWEEMFPSFSEEACKSKLLSSLELLKTL